jgi:hypothetical protein
MKVSILLIGLFLFAASHASALNINDPAPLFSFRDGSGGYFHRGELPNMEKVLRDKAGKLLK